MALFDNVVTPDYHLLLKLKYMLILISEIQEEEINLPINNLKSNLFYLLDKYFFKYDKLKKRDKNILNSICNELKITLKKLDSYVLNRFFVPNDISERIREEVADLENDSTLSSFADWIEILQQERIFNSFDVIERAKLYTSYILYSELSNYEGFDFLMTYSELMYVYSSMFISNSMHTNHLDYCYLYDKLCCFKCYTFDKLINYTIRMENDISEHAIGVKLYDIDAIKYPQINKYYKWLVEIQTKIYLNSVICGISFYDYSNNFIVSALDEFRKNLNLKEIYTNIIMDWVKLDENYNMEMPSFVSFLEIDDESSSV